MRSDQAGFVLARHDLANRIAVLMGGRASEALIFDGEVSTGAADDLQRATEIALQMVTRFGMDGTVGQRTYSRCPSRSWWRSRATCLPARSGAPTSSRSRAAIPKDAGADDGRLRRCVATAGTENVSRPALELRLSGRYFTGLAPTVQMVHLFSVHRAAFEAAESGQ